MHYVGNCFYYYCEILVKLMIDKECTKKSEERGRKMLQLFRKRLSNRKGFTLVELLVVISIIGILSAIAIPKFTSATATARGAKIQADLRTLDSAIQIYNASAGTYPAALATLAPNFIATVPASLTAGAEWATKTRSGSAGGDYGMSGDRATFSGLKVEELQ